MISGNHWLGKSRITHAIEVEPIAEHEFPVSELLDLEAAQGASESERKLIGRTKNRRDGSIMDGR